MELEDLIKWLKLITVLVVGVCGIILLITLVSLGPDMFDQLTTLFQLLTWIESM